MKIVFIFCRDLGKYLRELKLRNKMLSAGGLETPPLLIEILRASVNNGKIARVLPDTSTNEGAMNMYYIILCIYLTNYFFGKTLSTFNNTYLLK